MNAAVTSNSNATDSLLDGYKSDFTISIRARQQTGAKPEDEANTCDTPTAATPSTRPVSATSCRRQDQPPDGGWGWAIVFAALSINLIQDGVSFSCGLLFIEHLREFGESSSKTSWIGAVFLAMPLLAGPLASALVERFGCRIMTVFGGLLSTAGFVISALCKSVEGLLLTFGVMAGLGLAIGYVTVVVSVAYWFEKRRSLANGLGMCGTGIGTFVFAPLTQYCVGEYGWRGATLLLGGAFLHLCVCGTLMTEPPYRQRQLHSEKKLQMKRRSMEMYKDRSQSPTAGDLNSAIPLQERQTSGDAFHDGQEVIRSSTIGTRKSARQKLLRRVRSAATVAWSKLDLSVFCLPAFFLLALATLILYVWFIVPYMYLAEFMLRSGHEYAQTSAIIAVIGVSNTVGMIALGWAGDKPWLPLTTTFGACLVLCGISCILMPLLVTISVEAIAFAAAAFGLTLAASFSFTMVVMLRLMPLERFAHAYGLMLLVKGIGNLLGPPIAGAVTDFSGTWDMSFYLAGVFIIVSGVMTLGVGWISPAANKSPEA